MHKMKLSQNNIRRFSVQALLNMEDFEGCSFDMREQMCRSAAAVTLLCKEAVSANDLEAKVILLQQASRHLNEYGQLCSLTGIKRIQETENAVNDLRAILFNCEKMMKFRRQKKHTNSKRY